MPKTIDTLVADINSLFMNGHLADPHNLARFGEAMSATVAKRLTEKRDEGFRLRLSQIGKPDRQVWYDAHGQGQKELLSAPARIKFLYGDLLEELLWFLAVEAGHEVTDRQKEVYVDGVPGHLDGKIDGIIVDTKSASSFGFKKFAEGRLAREDDFGYMWQAAAYTHAEGAAEMGFLVIDKTLGHICLDRHSDDLKHYNVPERIKELRAVLDMAEPPERCFDDMPDGKSGNRKLEVGCAYCAHKAECWPELRTFLYANGPRFLTKVVRTPDVYEVPKGESLPIEESTIETNG